MARGRRRKSRKPEAQKRAFEKARRVLEEKEPKRLTAKQFKDPATVARRRAGRMRRQEQALDVVAELAVEGYVPAQYLLGLQYQLGRVGPREWLATPPFDEVRLLEFAEEKLRSNDRRAAMWYRRAAEVGYSPGQRSLGLMYLRGMGVEKNAKEGLKWLRKAARQKDEDAQFFLGQAYDEGWGVERDAKKAVHWFKKAAAQGHSYAQMAVGGHYAWGEGVARDMNKALGSYERAAQSGNHVACFYLGYFYEYGYGVERNAKLARQWYRRFARKSIFTPFEGKRFDSVEESVVLGGAFETGFPECKDLERAREFYEEAREKLERWKISGHRLNAVVEEALAGLGAQTNPN